MSYPHSRSLRLARFASVAALLLTFVPRSGVAADLAFVPNPGFVCDTLVVDATVDASVTDLRGFSFVFEFNPSAVTPIAVVAGPLETGAVCGHFFTWVNAAAIGDSIYVDGATLGCSVAGPGAIVRMTFLLASHSAVSPLLCRRGSMRDALNQSIPYVCHQGLLTTCSAIGVEPSPWTRVKRYYR